MEQSFCWRCVRLTVQSLIDMNRRGRYKADSIFSNRFLFNPFSIATCIARSSSVFTNCAILYAIDLAISGKKIPAAFSSDQLYLIPLHLGHAVASMFALSVSTYLSLYPLLLLPPLALLCFDHHKPRAFAQSALSFSIYCLGLCTSAILGLLFLSHAMPGLSWEYLTSTYGFHLLLPDLTPNVGLWWYFFIEMFDAFRAFFLGVFWLHLGGYVVGLTIRIRYDLRISAIETLSGTTKSTTQGALM